MPGTYEPIATQTLGSTASSVTFSSIPSTYTDLILASALRNDTATYQVAKITFNGDTGSNYSYTRLGTDGSSAPFSDRSSGFAYIDGSYTWGTNGTSNTFTQMDVQIQNYSNATTYKTSLIRQSGVYTIATLALWSSVSAITSLTVTANSGNWIAGSTFTLYGIKAA
jgi:membrane-bound inhibitor of C-type lysozyme